MWLLNKIGGTLGLLSFAVLVLSVAALPWLLGGVIPLARFVMLTAAVISALLSIGGAILCWKFERAVPAVLLPLAGLVLLGIFQLRETQNSPVAAMDHAILQWPSDGHDESARIGSVAPAETRSAVAMFAALTLIASTAFSQMRSAGRIYFAGVVLIGNAVVVSSVGLVQLFSADGLWLNQIWALSDNLAGRGFAAFINPNNAAGWLCIGFACAAGWLSFMLQRSASDGKQKYGRLDVPAWQITWQKFVNSFADLTAWQILAIVVVAFVGAGVLATQSRGGIVALVLATSIAMTLQSSVRKTPAILLMIVVCGGGTYGLLTWFDLDQKVIGELETLQDIDAENDTRTILWLDSLNALRDFPISGTGLGSYQFAMLPYQSQDTTLWFRNADNQFVEILVEGGVLGLLLFALVGTAGLITGFGGWKQKKKKSPKSRSGQRISRRLLGAVAFTAILATLAQAVSGLFDFGIGLPATSSFLVLVVAGISGFLDESDSTVGISGTGAVSCHPLIVVSLQAGLIAAASVLFNDQLAAVQLDKSVVASERVLSSPMSLEKLDRLQNERKLLQQRLQDRPDDAHGLRALTRLAIAEFRWETLKAYDPEVVENPKLASIWKDFRLEKISDFLMTLRTEDPYGRAKFKDVLIGSAAASGIKEVLLSTNHQYPLIPQVASLVVQTSAVLEESIDPNYSARARFLKPASSSTAFRLGLFALRTKQQDLAKDLWLASLASSVKYRSAIMQDAVLYWDADETMKLFGPATYDECVLAARSSRSAELRQSLWGYAADLWPSVKTPVSEETASLRAAQLVYQKQNDAAIAWLEEAMKQPGDNLTIGRDLAKLYEQEGRYKDALNQWRRIQYLRPQDAASGAAITRIMNLK